MNKLVRGLLSGASLVTLQLCAVSAARAAGTTITGAHGAVTNPAGSTQDFILVTGATITGDLTNEGTVGPGASYGIEVEGSTISGAVINAATGVIHVTGTNNLTGIKITANSPVAGGVQNNGSILISASSSKDYHQAEAIDYVSNSVAHIANTGAINVNVSVVGSGTSEVTANAYGVFEYVASGSAVDEAYNSAGGSITLSAHAANKSTESSKAKAFANAESGVRQDGFDGPSIAQAITNSGTMSLTASAQATGTRTSKVTAEAHARNALVQEAESAGDWINQQIANTGSIGLAASATAIGHDNVFASAKVGTALSQYAYDGVKAAQLITNTGALTLSAKAKATAATSSVTAKAYVRNVIEQQAYDFSGNVNQSITNSGAMTLSAAAAAKGSDSVKAYASVEDAIYQDLGGAASATQKISNSGALGFTAKAKATATDGSATAKAFVGAAAGQYVDEAATISQSITNTGHLTFAATATAKGVSSANAKANVGYVFGQDAYYSDTISQSITNSGGLTIGAHADAVAASSKANAYATAKAHHLFTQKMNNFGTPTETSSVTQAITNNGDVSIALTADASRISDTPHFQCCSEVRAQVSVSRLFYQEADDAVTITQSITNTGNFTITGKAQAVSDGIKTYGDANLDQLFEQDASGNAATITQSIMNKGAFAVTMTAAATGVKGAAFARFNRAFTQYADATTEISQTLSNSGAIAIAMAATAVESRYATASAHAKTAVKQRAFDASEITQSITNSASFTLALTANAKNTGSSAESARAFARAEGMKQTAEGIGSIEQTITNSSTFGLTLGAKATNVGTFERADASARMYTDIKQHANFTGSTEVTPGKITQIITNDGTLSLDATAVARGGHTAVAEAKGNVFVKQYAENAGDISESFTNSGSILLSETANAHNDVERATADAGLETFVKQYSDQNGNEGDTASLTAVNKATIAASVNAAASGRATDKVYADAFVGEFASQSAYDAATATESVTNSGSITVSTGAASKGLYRAEAYAGSYGLMDQELGAVANGTITAVNSGSIVEGDVAKATGTQYATAIGEAFAGWQSLSRDGFEGDIVGTMSITNSGTIDLRATGTAKAGLNLVAGAEAWGFEQELDQMPGTAEFDNSNAIRLTAVATGLPGTLGTGVTRTTAFLPRVYASAVGLDVIARGTTGVFHNNSSATTKTNGAALTVAIHNSGTLQVSATANGAALAAANIFATATGVHVHASSKTGRTRATSVTGSSRNWHTTSYRGGGTVKGSIDNSGSLLVSASADGGIATAKGVWIEVNSISADITNETGGLISVDASGATAVAAGIALSAHGSAQREHGHSSKTAHGQPENFVETETKLNGAATAVTGNITNSGTISVSATSTGANIGDGNISEPASIGPTPPSSSITRADGISVNAFTMSGNILNAGTINVSAVGAAAVANGIHVFASQTGLRSVETGAYKWRGSQTGFQWTYVSHSTPISTGVLEGSKFTGTVSNSGTISVAAKGAATKATGVLIDDETFDGTFVNTGKIIVVANGDGASATGVKIDASSIGDGASFQNDGGTISATLNGGWGTAIDVSGAPSSLILALEGGSIFGNVVENAAGNSISIGAGNLLLDGMINPSKAKLGSLVVGRYGTLTLATNPTLGAASAYVGSFNQPGTLAIVGEADGTSGSIHAASATISGPAIVNLDLSRGVYGTSTTFQVVFSDAALSGTWSNVSANGASTFFSAKGVYSTNEADITLTRATFDSITGLTDNEKAVAGAIETIYDGDGTSGPLGKLLSALFNLTPDQYADALDSLSGIPIGELLAVDQATAQSFLDAINNHLGGTTGDDGDVAALSSTSQMLAANVAPTAVTPAQATNVSGTNVWGGGFQSGNSVNRTASGPAYDSHNNGLLAGVDVPVSRDFLFGVAGSWSTGDIQVEKMLGFGTFKALQVAGYARYTADNGIYAMGDVSYGDFTNRLNRFISIPGFGSGNVHGKFDSTAWGLYGETGWKFNPSGWATSLTPYAAVSYLDAKTNGFTETGFGPPLVVNGASSKATSSYLGLKMSTDWDIGTATITPRVTAAWQHDFTKNAWEMSAAFAAVPTAGFQLNGSDLSRDGAFLDGGITVHIADQVNVLLDYQGRFTSDRTDNAFMARANVRF